MLDARSFSPASHTHALSRAPSLILSLFLSHSLKKCRNHSLSLSLSLSHSHLHATHTRSQTISLAAYTNAHTHTLSSAHTSTHISTHTQTHPHTTSFAPSTETSKKDVCACSFSCIISPSLARSHTHTPPPQPPPLPPSLSRARARAHARTCTRSFYLQFFLLHTPGVREGSRPSVPFSLSLSPFLSIYLSLPSAPTSRVHFAQVPSRLEPYVDVVGASVLPISTNLHAEASKLKHIDTMPPPTVHAAIAWWPLPEHLIANLRLAARMLYTWRHWQRRMNVLVIALGVLRTLGPPSAVSQLKPPSAN